MAGIFDFFLNMDYLWIIIIISFLISLLSTLVYKWVTDQNKLKRIKKEVKELQADMKKHKNDQKKMMKIQQEMLSKNGEMMKQSFKPMLFTIIPLFIVFGWMSATLAYQPLLPNQPFTVTATLASTYTGNLSQINLSAAPANLNITTDSAFVPKNKEVRWIVEGNQEGKYTLLIEGQAFKQTKEILITTQKKYDAPTATFKDSPLQKVIVGNKEVQTVFGLSWFWAYLIASLIFSLIIKKVLNVA